MTTCLLVAEVAGEKENGAPVALSSTKVEKEEDKATDAAAADVAIPNDKSTAVVADEQQPPPVVATGTSSSSAVSANAFASGSNQNSGNVMTGRPTSRVLAPPGGHCSIQLF